MVMAWLLPFVAFVLLPVADQLLPMREDELEPTELEQRKTSLLYDIPLYLMLPIQWALVYLLLSECASLSFGDLNGIWLGWIFTIGICCGTFGINVAHELGHRNGWHSQWSAKGLLLSSLYLHFIIEHNQGHHRHVATEKDPATSRYNQTVYAFWLQSIVGSWQSAWQLESERLKKHRLPWTNNEMIWFSLVELGLLFSMLALFGGIAVLSFGLAALVGILLLETINYLEHYGLGRVLRKNGKFEQVQPHHSWNCNRSMGRLILFELTRHSDHHAHAKRPYQILRHYETAPQLPAGYPAMILIALCPPLWFAIMNPRLQRYTHPQSC